MFKVIDIRGTHGSGKSTIPTTIIKLYDSVPIIGTPLTLEGRSGVLGYDIPELNLRIVGPYNSACGGCDQVKTQAEIKARVDAWRVDGNVMLEGILVSHTFQPWLEFSEDKNWHFLFLDTPMQTCIDRVLARRAAKGNDKPFNPKNLVKDWTQIRSLQPKFAAKGRKSHWVEHGMAYEQVLSYLENN